MKTTKGKENQYDEITIDYLLNIRDSSAPLLGRQVARILGKTYNSLKRKKDEIGEYSVSPAGDLIFSVEAVRKYVYGQKYKARPVISENKNHNQSEIMGSILPEEFFGRGNRRAV